jgi:transposase
MKQGLIGMLTEGMSTRAVAREFKVNFSTISRCFREFGGMCNRPHNCRPHLWRMGKQFADVNVVK